MNIKNIFKIRLPFLFLFGVSLFLIFSDFVLAQTLGGGREVLGVSKKVGVESNAGKNKSDEKNAKNNPDVGAHISKVKNASLDIKKVANAEKKAGNVEISEEIIESVEEISYASVENISSLEEVENRPAWKTFLLGPDYKNLGQIRSNLVQTRNQIRNLEKTMEKNMGEEESNTLRARLGVLEEERLKIFNYIDQKDDGFSLFGWLAKLMSGYNKSIEENADLGDEVEIHEEVEDIEEDIVEEGDNIEESVPEETDSLEEGIEEETENTETTETVEDTEGLEEDL